MATWNEPLWNEALWGEVPFGPPPGVPTPELYAVLSISPGPVAALSISAPGHAVLKLGQGCVGRLSLA